ncbi:MAG: hypothetical protein ACTSU4_06805 [Promethearchaeota archaeon]
MGKLPRNQYMDAVTLNWIRENEPAFNAEPLLELNLKLKIEDHLHEIENYIPQIDWFLILKKKDTIHGLRHVIRVMINSFVLLTLKKKRFETCFKNALVASSIHDLRRRSDLMDINHGKRAARWFKNNITLIEKQYNISLSSHDIDEIYHAIIFHNIPYSKIEKEKYYLKYKILTDILKTADALDRYRLPSIRLWFKAKYISYLPPDYIKHFAFQLVIFSEAKFLEGLTNKDSVLMAVKELFQ